jgi:SAM-dependent methyltransferase
MRQELLGRQTTRWIPLPVDRHPRTQWKPFKTGAALREVPYVPSPQHVVDEMLRAAGVTDRDIVYDLGCGDGRIVVTAAKTYGARAVGVEIDPQRIKECWQNAADAGVSDRVEFLEQSFFEIDYTPATVVTLYLLPWVNVILRPKLLEQLRPGARIVAHAFSLRDWTPDRVIRIPGSRVLYVWMVPARVGGRWRCTLRLPDGRTHSAVLELEQEFQTVLGHALIEHEQVALENISLFGDRLRFSVRDPASHRQMTYLCQVQGDQMRGVARSVGKTPRTFELRARREGEASRAGETAWSSTFA